MEQMAFLWKHQANLCNNTFSNSESQNLIDFMESPAFLILPTGVSELNFERVPIWLIQRLLNQLSLTVLKKLTLQRCDCESSFSLMTRVSFRLALTMTQLTIEGNDRTNTFGVIGHLPLENFSSLQDLTLKRCHKIGPVLARYQKPKLESLRIPLDWDAAPLEFEELGHFLNRFQGLHSLSLETPTKFEDDLVESFLRGIEMHRDTLHPFIFRDSLLRVHDFCDSPYRQRDLDDADFRYSRISNTARKCALLSQLELPFLPTDALHEQCMELIGDLPRLETLFIVLEIILIHQDQEPPAGYQLSMLEWSITGWQTWQHKILKGPIASREVNPLMEAAILQSSRLTLLVFGCPEGVSPESYVRRQPQHGKGAEAAVRSD